MAALRGNDYYRERRAKQRYERGLYQLAEVGDFADEPIVPSQKFLDEFPSGVVPIRRADHIYPQREDPYQALINTLTIADYERKVDLIDAVRALGQRLNAAKAVSDYAECAAVRKELRVAVKNALRGGVGYQWLATRGGVARTELTRCWSNRFQNLNWEYVHNELKRGRTVAQISKVLHCTPAALRTYAMLVGATPTQDEWVDRVEAEQGSLSRNEVVWGMEEEIRAAGWSPRAVVEWCHKRHNPERAERQNAASRAQRSGASQSHA